MKLENRKIVEKKPLIANAGITMREGTELCGSWGRRKKGEKGREYYSQLKQDEFLHKKVFKNFKRGTFLDIGAFDGVKYSNTYFFEKTFGWNGFCFEPVPDSFKKLIKNRNCKCYNNCIGNEEGIVEFTWFKDAPMSSGITNNLDEQELENILKKGTSIQTFLCKVINIKKFLEQNRINEIHLLSIDIEGNEEKVLKIIDFDKTFIHTICVEDNLNEKKVDILLKNEGFSLLKHGGFDKIFINKKSKFFPKSFFLWNAKARCIGLLYTSKVCLIIKRILNTFPKMRKIKERLMGV